MSDYTVPFRCASCGLADRLSPVLIDICVDCLSQAARRAREALIEVGLPTDPELLLDGRLLTDVGMSFLADLRPDVLQAGDAEAVARHRAHLVWLLADRLADAEQELEEARGELRRQGLLMEGDDVVDGIFHALHRAFKSEQQWRETERELEFEAQFAEHDRLVALERFYRERQYRVNVAAIARRMIARAHAAGCSGTVETCPTCAADWAVVVVASGVTAPAR